MSANDELAGDVQALMRDLLAMPMNSRDTSIRMPEVCARDIATRLVEFDPEVRQIESVAFQVGDRVTVRYRVRPTLDTGKLTFVIPKWMGRAVMRGEGAPPAEIADPGPKTYDAPPPPPAPEPEPTPAPQGHVEPDQQIATEEPSPSQATVKLYAGGWFVDNAHGASWSGPWNTRQSAEAAKEGDFTKAWLLHNETKGRIIP